MIVHVNVDINEPQQCKPLLQLANNTTCQLILHFFLSVILYLYSAPVIIHIILSTDLVCIHTPSILFHTV